MSDLIDTTEMFLKVIVELNEQGRPATRARIGERLHQAAPSVSQTVARMERDGLLLLQTDKSIVLTDAGSTLATSVMRKHRLAERLLVDLLDYPWWEAHEEACHWEHVIGDLAEGAIAAKVAHVDVDPYGNAIPGGGASLHDQVAVGDLPSPSTGEYLLVALGEFAQARPGFLRQVWDAGLRIDATVIVENDGEGIAIRHPENDMEIWLDRELASNVFVRR
jgi:DtxR family Mn-dependent transcriptional regulator